MTEIASIGLDIAKSWFQVHGADAQGRPVLGRKLRRDRRLRTADLIASGPRSPRPGAPPTYVTTPTFLAMFGFASLRDLPDIEALEDAGLLDKAALRADPFKAFGLPPDDPDSEDREDREVTAPRRIG